MIRCSFSASSFLPHLPSAPHSFSSPLPSLYFSSLSLFPPTLCSYPYFILFSVFFSFPFPIVCLIFFLSAQVTIFTLYFFFFFCFVSISTMRSPPLFMFNFFFFIYFYLFCVCVCLSVFFSVCPSLSLSLSLFIQYVHLPNLFPFFFLSSILYSSFCFFFHFIFLNYFTNHHSDSSRNISSTFNCKHKKKPKSS